MTVERLYRDGKTAVIISPGFGAGWSTWKGDGAEFMRHDRQLCQFVLEGNLEAVRARCDAVLGEGAVYYGGLANLKVEWVLTGSPFYIHEYDGSEGVVTDFLIA